MKLVFVKAGTLVDMETGEVSEGKIGDKVDAWVCRREEDFPPGRIPRDAGSGECSRCQARVVYNPSKPMCGPKVCFQCIGIEPIPFPVPAQDLGGKK